MFGITLIPSPTATYYGPEPVVKDYSREGLKTLITEAFPDEPIMLCIAEKESGTAQFRPSGAILESPTKDYGLMQINQVHLPEAERLGLDVKNSVEDNLAMAKIVKARQGYKAWATYSKCYNHLAQQGN